MILLIYYFYSEIIWPLQMLVIGTQWINHGATEGSVHVKSHTWNNASLSRGMVAQYFGPRGPHELEIGRSLGQSWELAQSSEVHSRDACDLSLATWKWRVYLSFSSPFLSNGQHNTVNYLKNQKKKDKKLAVCSNTLLYSYKWLDESYFININNLWDNVCCAAYFVAGTDIGKFTMKTVDDVRTLNKSVHFRPSCNCLNINELASVWEKKIGRTLPRVTVTEDDLLAAAGGGVTLFTFIL